MPGGKPFPIVADRKSDESSGVFARSTVFLLALWVLRAVATAGEAPAGFLESLSPTSLGGYVDTSAELNPGSGNANLPRYKLNGACEANGFNLDVVQVRIDRPLAEAAWSAGYRVDLWAGPDAAALGTHSILSAESSAFAIRQAYIALSVPLGNGLGCKIGVFDSPIGYESLESPINPNFTLSYGRSIEPQTLTGALFNYRFSELLAATVGVANTVNSAIDSRAQQGSAGGYFGGAFGAVSPGQNAYAESYKAYMGAVSISAPANLRWLSGSTLTLGVVNGYNNSGGLTRAFSDPAFGSAVGLPELNTYAGVALTTPLKGLRVGAAFDWLDFDSQVGVTGPGGHFAFNVDAETWTLAGYASYQATGKLSFHARYEYVDSRIDSPVGFETKTRLMATTLTTQYDLWRNVLTRLEFRWDRSLTGENLFGGDSAGQPARDNAWLLAANVVYRF